MKEKVAILVDGDFFIRRHFRHFGKTHDEISPAQMATNIHNHCLKHLDKDNLSLQDGVAVIWTSRRRSQSPKQAK